MDVVGFRPKSPAFLCYNQSMSEEALINPTTEFEEIVVDIDHIITEDDAPVDNWFSEKQQRLLAKTLYTSWKPNKPFVAGVDIGIFPALHEPPIVPDVLVSLDAKIAKEWLEKRHRTYFVWEFGKPPEVVIEIVSNKKGGELDKKLERYARIGCWYYVIYDSTQQIQAEPLRIYELLAGHYRLRDDTQLAWLNLGLTLWEGTYEGQPATFLRWTDENGSLLPNDEEAIAMSESRANDAESRADQAESRANALAAKLRALGVDPDSD